MQRHFELCINDYSHAIKMLDYNVMDNFEHLKKKALNNIYFEAGAGLFDSQYFEYSIKYLIYLLSKVDSLNLDTEFAKKIIDDEEKMTCGQLIKYLKKRFTLNPDFEAIIAQAIKSRNNLIHNYFLSNTEKMADINNYTDIEKEIRNIRASINSASKYLVPVIRSLAKIIDNIDLSRISENIKTDFMSHFPE